MMSRGNGGTPRQEPKRKTGGKKKGRSGTGSPVGWKANQQKRPHRALAGVDPALFRDLLEWSARRTFTHQFRVAAARPPALPTQAPPSVPTTYQPVRVSKSPPPGLAAVKHAQQQREARGAALAEADHRRPGPPARRGGGPSSLGELYAYYKATGRLAEFFSLFPAP
jgi:hypothetical protein